MASGEAGDEAIGIIAGQGWFPVYFAREARQHFSRVVILAIRDEARFDDLARHADRIYRVGLARVGGMIRRLRREGVRRAVMAGKVRKRQMYRRFWYLSLVPDWTTLRILFSLKGRDRKDDSLLGAVADVFESNGIKMESSVLVMPKMMAEKGRLAGREPGPQEWRDIRFGWRLAREMGRLDVGQSVVVKKQSVLAVEAVEGTDENIRRGGRLGESGVVVVKVAKPGQDMRFDVPVVGPDTVRAMAEVKARVLAIEAGQTLVIDRAEMAAAAEAAGITVLALSDEEAADAGGGA